MAFRQNDAMRSNPTASGVLLLTVVAVWGCAVSPDKSVHHRIQLPAPGEVAIGQDEAVSCEAETDLGKIRFNGETERYEICR